jgi:hypothetical protein
MEIPVLSADLIAALNKEFPLFNPSLTLPETAIRHRAGQRSVVEMLLVSLENQESDLMKKKKK